MKKLLFLLIATFVAMSVSAGPVDQVAAQRKARNYLANEMYAGKIMAPAALNPVLLKAEPRDAKRSQPVYYIYNTSTTFLVIAGDDRAEEILMVGDYPLKDINNLPPAMQDILNMYKEEINFLFDNPTIKVERMSEKNTSLRAVTYGPLLTAEWDQDAPYNNLCKFTYNNRSYTCLTGCPATSAAMVMYHWKCPAGVGAMASYSSTLDIGYNQSVNFTYPALEATTFDWANMKDKYTSYTSAQASAVATLMRYIGQAEQMMYGTEAAGGSGIYTNETYKVVNMFKNWGYASTVAVKYKSSYSATNWANLLIAELAAGRPMIYNGVSTSGGGHAFNVDGYRDSDSKWHVNFGWSGDGNSWYSMNSFSYGGYTFSSDQQAVIGIEPAENVPTPVLSVNPTSLSFTGETGSTYTQTFTVSGTDLTGNVTISSSSSRFTVSPSTLTAAQAMAGATITVTYSPTTATTSNGTITVASTGAESKTVSVTGTATAPGPKLVADPNSLSFTTTVGTSVSQTFHLTGTNLSGIVNLSCSGDDFSVNPTAISKTAATNGYDITVTYDPETSGTHTGTVTISSTGAQSITVALNGTATASPVITVNPTSLSFSTTVGQAVTKTFTVSGSDLTGNISLSCSGTGFSIDKTTINRNTALNGTTVTVTYNPTAGGSHTGTVTLTSNGAQTRTVTLSGTASTVPTLTVNPTSLNFNAVVGTPVTKTFTLNGANLIGAVNLAVSGTGFTIDKTYVNSTTAMSGTTVTVTYTPTAAGNHTGTVTLTSSGAQTVTVALNGTATEPVRTITATPATLNFSTMVNETVSQNFNVSGENLTGDLTLTLEDANGVYSITPTTISAAAAMAGNVPVTVTYTPGTFGLHNATVTIAGGGAPAATVTLNGQADLLKYAPVMLPADERYINLTKFRADWTDETPEANVASYTLEVTPKAVEPEPEPELIASLSGTSYSGNGYYNVTLTAPWEGLNVHGHNNAILYFRSNYNGDGVLGYISYTVPAGYENAVFTMKITSGTDAAEAVGNVTVSSTQTAGVTKHFDPNETHSWVVVASSGEKITITTPDDNYSPDMALIEVYSGNAGEFKLMANETGDANNRLITGITDKFYTVNDLTAEGTFLYRVKAIYQDGTESDWSNVEEVTLFENGHGYELGDVNHDGYLTVADVTMLISYVLANGVGDACPICADMNADGLINVGDVTALINKVLGGSSSALMMMSIIEGR